jgi:hypothetical protein
MSSPRLADAVVVVDTEEDRLVSMHAVLRDLVQVLVVGPDGALQFHDPISAEWQKYDASPPDALICLRHLRDARLRSDLTALVTVYYGGNPPHDSRYWGGDDADPQRYPRSPFDWEEGPEGYLLHRAVSPTGNDGLSNHEARDLVSWARAVRRGETTDLPVILRPRAVHEHEDYLYALFILCQGYLAACARVPGLSADVEHALSVMGWTDFVQSSDAERILANLKAAAGVVGTADWWLGVLGRDEVALDAEDLCHLRHVSELVGRLREMDKAKAPPSALDPDLVAATFLELLSHLAGESA